MNLSKLKVAVATMNSTPDYVSNMKLAEKLVGKAAICGAKWVVLPEMFPVLGDSEKIKSVAKSNSKEIHKKVYRFSSKIRKDRRLQS